MQDISLKNLTGDTVLKFDLTLKQWILNKDNMMLCVKDIDALDRRSLSLLPFLDYSFDDVNLLILQQSKKNPESSAEITDFPWENFFNIAFKHGTEHWVSKALGWLDNMDLRMQSFYEVRLVPIIQDKKRFSQKTRQSAFKILKGLEKKSPDLPSDGSSVNGYGARKRSE